MAWISIAGCKLDEESAGIISCCFRSCLVRVPSVLHHYATNCSVADILLFECKRFEEAASFWSSGCFRFLTFGHVGDGQEDSSRVRQVVGRQARRVLFSLASLLVPCRRHLWSPVFHSARRGPSILPHRTIDARSGGHGCRILGTGSG